MVPVKKVLLQSITMISYMMNKRALSGRVDDQIRLQGPPVLLSCTFDKTSEAHHTAEGNIPLLYQMIRVCPFVYQKDNDRIAGSEMYGCRKNPTKANFAKKRFSE